MHLTMLAVGSRGDVQPFVALGVGLQQAGHTVRLATHQPFESFVRGAGLDFAPVEGNPQAIVQSEEGRKWLQTERNPLNFARGFRALMGPLMQQALQDSLRAAEGTDAIIVTGSSYYFGDSVATKLNVPFVQAYVQPVHPTHDYPSALFPMASGGHRLINYATYLIGGQIFWQLLRPTVNEARRDLLGLPPHSRLGAFIDHMKQRLPVVYGFSEAVLPRPKNWQDFISVTGYWFYDEQGWTPPADLLDFLLDGAPPVYIGFGSMTDDDPARMTDIALTALKRAKQRGILLTGWGGLAQGDLPDNVFKLESAPHGWLFPRMAAIVHHGGAGTTAAGLRAGKPTVIVPFFGDQPFWGYRVMKLGVGQMVTRKQLSADSLGAAIERAVTDTAMQARAAALGERIRAENGVQRATDIITRYLEQVTGRARIPQV